MRYISTQGQEVVSEKYTAVAKPGSFLSDKAGGEIKIGGSTSATPLVKELADKYMEINPSCSIEILSIGFSLFTITCTSSFAISTFVRSSFSYDLSSRDDIPMSYVPSIAPVSPLPESVSVTVILAFGLQGRAKRC